jgi:hypothetical protein
VAARSLRGTPGQPKHAVCRRGADVRLVGIGLVGNRPAAPDVPPVRGQGGDSAGRGCDPHCEKPNANRLDAPDPAASEAAGKAGEVPSLDHFAGLASRTVLQRLTPLNPCVRCCLPTPWYVAAGHRRDRRTTLVSGLGRGAMRALILLVGVTSFRPTAGDIRRALAGGCIVSVGTPLGSMGSRSVSFSPGAAP